MKERSKTRKTKKHRTSLPELVIITIAEDSVQAGGYESLLKASDIPVIVKEQHNELTGNGFAVLVPEDCIDEAHVIIESQDAYDDYYDLTINDDNLDLDDDFMDDDF